MMSLFFRNQSSAWVRRMVLCALAGIVLTHLARGEASDYIHYRLGVKYKSEHKYEQALDEFRRVLAAYPDNYNSYMNIAEIQLAQNQSRLAIHNLKKALAYNPGWSKAYRMLATAYADDRQLQNAIKQWQEYQQVCDPAEADSVQRVISQLVKRVQGGAPPDSQAGAAQSAVGVHDTSGAKAQKVDLAARKTKTAVRTTTPHHAAAAPEALSSPANEDFKRAVVAYQDAVNNQDAKKFEEALAFLQKTLDTKPGHAGAFYYAGLIRRRFGQNQLAKINFEKALAYPELGYNAHFYLGKIYGEERNYPAAIDHLGQYAGATDYLAGKREALALIGRYQALLEAQRADTVKIDVDAVSREALHEEISKIPPPAGYAQVEVRIDSLLSMIVMDTLTDPGQAMLAGVRLFSEDKFDAAIGKFKQAQAAFPQGDVAAHCLYDMGVCYLKLRDYNAADNMFQQVISRYPGKSIAAKSLFFKAFAYGERHDMKVAETLLRQFIQANRAHPWVGKAWERLGDAYADLEQQGKSIDAYGQAALCAVTPLDKVYAQFKQGNVYLRIGNPQRAVETWKAMITEGEKRGVFERVPDAYYKIADYLYKKGDLSQALDYYTRATRKYPTFQDTPWGLFQMGGIYKNEKHFDKAIAAFNELIERYPDDYWARQAQWKKDDTVWENEYGAVLD
jgi:tetratricopeptide (TPR) repeat protein